MLNVDPWARDSGDYAKTCAMAFIEACWSEGRPYVAVETFTLNNYCTTALRALVDDGAVIVRDGCIFLSEDSKVNVLFKRAKK